MTALTLKLFLLVVVVSALTAARRRRRVRCLDPACVTQTSAAMLTVLENQFVYFNLKQIPDDMAEQCEAFVGQLSRCRNNVKVCPIQPKKPLTGRFNSTVQVRYLVKVGKHVCSHSVSILQLKSCATCKLQDALGTCVTAARRVDYKCIRKKYKAKEKCAKRVDRFIKNLLKLNKWRNPYNIKSIIQFG